MSDSEHLSGPNAPQIGRLDSSPLNSPHILSSPNGAVQIFPVLEERCSRGLAGTSGSDAWLRLLGIGRPGSVWIGMGRVGRWAALRCGDTVDRSAVEPADLMNQGQRKWTRTPRARRDRPGREATRDCGLGPQSALCLLKRLGMVSNCNRPEERCTYCTRRSAYHFGSSQVF